VRSDKIDTGRRGRPAPLNHSGRGRSAHAGGPDDGLGFQFLVAIDDPIGAAFDDRLSERDFNAETFPSERCA